MKRFLSFLFFAFLILSLSGCEIKFTALTKINTDGSGFRITTYSAEGEDEKEELLNRYNLPEGGSWKKERAKRPSFFGSGDDWFDKHIYETKVIFKDLNKFTPDYIRKGINPENVSNNRISLKIKKGLVFTTYDYEEIFRDSANEKQIRQFCDEYYSYVLNLASEELEAALPKAISKDEAKAFLNDIYRSDFDYLVALSLKVKDMKSIEFLDKADEFGKKISEENFLSLVANYITTQNQEIDKEVLQNKLKAVYAKIKERLQLYHEELSKNNHADVFGVYGIPIFVSYPFQISIIMPGRIISSNTKDIKLNTAKWSFSREDFFLKEYKLEVKSRRLNYANIMGFALGLITILILANLRKI